MLLISLCRNYNGIQASDSFPPSLSHYRLYRHLYSYFHQDTTYPCIHKNLIVNNILGEIIAVSDVCSLGLK